ncbi:hypothetical protein [Methylobacterium sp. AMS5]|nr:hypothetical protein [Methylobacterium sp. AMS5]AMB45049.1 hypothetical protein Y590_09085 [Methylobacterium sp. AMS5]
MTSVFVITPGDVFTGIMLAPGLVAYGCLVIPGAIRARRDKRRERP